VTPGLARDEHQLVALLDGLGGRQRLAVAHDLVEQVVPGALDADVRRSSPDGDRPRGDRDLHPPRPQNLLLRRFPSQQERRGQKQQNPADQTHRQRHRGEGQHAHVDPVIGGARAWWRRTCGTVAVLGILLMLVMAAAIPHRRPVPAVSSPGPSQLRPISARPPSDV
jgi:hypothetical protein